MPTAINGGHESTGMSTLTNILGTVDLLGPLARPPYTLSTRRDIVLSNVVVVSVALAILKQHARTKHILFKNATAQHLIHAALELRADLDEHIDTLAEGQIAPLLTLLEGYRVENSDEACAFYVNALGNLLSEVLRLEERYRCV